jgi:hypothetical protein
VSNGSLHFNIEKNLIRDGMIFLSGWACHETDLIRRIRLFIEVDTGSTQIVDAEMGYARGDVAAHFPDIPTATKAGFIVYGGWGSAMLRSLRIEFDCANAASTNISLFPLTGTAFSLRRAARSAGLLWSKGAQLIKTHGVHGTLTKVRNYARRRTKIDESALLALIASAKGARVVWIIDHDMGGGANQYRYQYVQSCLNEGKVVVVLSFQVASLGYFIQFHANDRVDRYAIGTLDDACEVARQLQIVQLVYNCAVSFREPIQVCKLLVRLRNEMGCELLVLLHDYFPVCPSHVLLNSDTTYCGLPDRLTCDACLNAHSGGFVSMANVRDIELWRKEWGRLIELADEVQVFSPSSWKLLLRAYPTISHARWRLYPHALPTQFPSLTLKAGKSLHIGVVGTLGIHKGANVVAGIAQEIQDARLSIPITIFGTSQTSEPSPGVRVTGPYTPESLPALVDASGANVFLFASIWPETFSYVAHELCSMGLPVVCFDMGAQADLIHFYRKGTVIKLAKSRDLLEELVRVWEESYLLMNKFI